MIGFISNLDHALGRLKTAKPLITGVGSSLPPITTSAAAASLGNRYAQSQVTYTQPQFYSPLHTPQNWQIPSKRREIYSWLRYFVENEPKVAAAIDFYSCFEPNMQVLMADGTQKAIAETTVGDSIRSHDGTINPVVKKYERHTIEEMLQIKVPGLNVIKCTKEHRFLTEIHGKIDFITANELRVGSYLLTPVSAKEESFRNIAYFEQNGFIYRKIRSIKPYQYNGKVYDLGIEGTHSYIVNRVAVHNCFPMNGFETQCDDSKIKHFYDNVNKKLNLDHWCKMISREYHLIGDVFPFLEVDCPDCKSTNVDKHGKPCKHKGGSFNRLVVLNPDWIDVQANQFAAEPVITLLPDDDLKKVIWNRRPKEIFDRIAPHLRQLILAGRPIPLDNTCVTHLKHNPYPYSVYGTSLIKRLLKTLTYKDKLMTAQWIVAERLILPIRVVKVGNAERPAGPSDIADIQQQLAQTATDPNLTLVTHHAFDYDWMGASGKVLTLSNEFELINQEILQGLMLNDALLSGTMGSYASSAIGAEALIQRMESWRLELARYIEDRIYKPIAEMRGFVDEAASKELGETVYIYPKIKWNDLNLRDDTQQKQLWMQLHDKQILSAESMCEKFDLDYDQEVERLRFETAQQQMAGGNAGAAPGGMGGMGGMGGGMGGAPGGGMDMGGGLGGPEMGGAPGAAPGAPAEMGGGMGGPEMGSPAGGATGTAMGGSQNKILTKGKASKLKPAAEEVAQPSGIRLTSLEQIMFKTITNLQQHFPFKPWIQYPLGKYRADFAIPQLKLAIECDGGIWHENPEKKAKDKIRDAELSKFGWTTLRFSETELKEKQPQVQKTVGGVIYKLWKGAIDQQKKQQEQFDKAGKTASEMMGEPVTGEIVMPEGFIEVVG
jgi:very-short-patch-repair endonuclease